MEEQVRAKNRLSRKTVYPPVEQILDQAEKRYKELCQTDEWSGLKNKGKAAVFRGEAATKHETICWNCGKTGHTVPNCPEPKNQKRIEANRNKMHTKTNNKNKTTGAGNQATSSNNPTTADGKFLFRPPEAGENNRRQIRDKHMFYLDKTKRWVLDRTHPSNKDATAQANTAATTTAAATTTEEKPQVNKPVLTAWMANAQKTYEQSLRDFAAQYA
jgi:hypothetical protein